MESLRSFQRLSLYAIVRRFFWLLPACLRNRLHDIRHIFVRWFRMHDVQRSRETGDLSWIEFSSANLQEEHRKVIIFEANVDWGITLFQRPQHMATALGRLGCLVIYKTTGDGVSGFRQVSENVWLANDNSVNDIPNAVRCFYSTSQLSSMDELLGAKSRGRVVYEYIDHIDASISGGSVSLRRLKNLKLAAFDGGADIVVASAKLLYKEALDQCGESRCIYVPNGVDVDHYRSEKSVSVVLPDTLLTFRRKYQYIVGYFGAIAPWLWYEVIKKVAEQMPHLGFVFIGPDYSGCVSKLPRQSNIFYVGAVEYAVLPAYANLFDACFIPFKPGEIARSTSPLKLYEYFALEKPVIVTGDMIECIAYPEVFSGSDADELVNAIDVALSVGAERTYRARLRELASANAWSLRAEVYLKALVDAECEC